MESLADSREKNRDGTGCANKEERLSQDEQINPRQDAMPKNVELREVTKNTVRAVCGLDAGDAGAQVAPNAVSIAQAYFAPEAWFRAICAGEELVGFLMLYDPTLSMAPEEKEFMLWRLMLDRRFQGRGYGHAAVEALVAHVRTRPGADALFVSHVKDAQPLARFYGSLGFVYTGDEEDGELWMRRPLSPV
jgi:diamine N-acetyltransferase